SGSAKNHGTYGLFCISLTTAHLVKSFMPETCTCPPPPVDSPLFLAISFFFFACSKIVLITCSASLQETKILVGTSTQSGSVVTLQTNSLGTARLIRRQSACKQFLLPKYCLSDHL